MLFLKAGNWQLDRAILQDCCRVSRCITRKATREHRSNEWLTFIDMRTKSHKQWISMTTSQQAKAAVYVLPPGCVLVDDFSSFGAIHWATINKQAVYHSCKINCRQQWSMINNEVAKSCWWHQRWLQWSIRIHHSLEMLWSFLGHHYWLLPTNPSAKTILSSSLMICVYL